MMPHAWLEKYLPDPGSFARAANLGQAKAGARRLAQPHRDDGQRPRRQSPAPHAHRRTGGCAAGAGDGFHEAPQILCRICPIETPEGPNIGLIASLSTFAAVNEYGCSRRLPHRRRGPGQGRGLVRGTRSRGALLIFSFLFFFFFLLFLLSSFIFCSNLSINCKIRLNTPSISPSAHLHFPPIWNLFSLLLDFSVQGDT